jgi:predicted lipoprotein
LGASRVHAYLLQGSGTIAGQKKKGITLKLADSNAEPTVLIMTRQFISGNAIRDASGKVNVNDFEDMMKFNQISSHINKIAVTEVINPFLEKTPKVGQQVTFIGAAEVAEDATEQTPFGSQDEYGKDYLLSVIPIQLSLDEVE